VLKSVEGSNCRIIKTIRPNLAASLGGLTLYDDLKQHVDEQLADIIQQSNASNAGGPRRHEIALSLSYARGRQGIEENGAREPSWQLLKN
jgi:hypothetical protein